MVETPRPVFNAGLVNLVDTYHRITPEVWLEPTPGHTPGHVAVRISSNGQEAAITGDLVHSPHSSPSQPGAGTPTAIRCRPGG